MNKYALNCPGRNHERGCFVAAKIIKKWFFKFFLKLCWVGPLRNLMKWNQKKTHFRLNTLRCMEITNSFDTVFFWNSYFLYEV